MSGHPRFTVVVPACDTAEWLPAALRSIRKQSFADFEALIAVEQSRDNSREIAEACAAEDRRFQVAALPRSGSAAASRNHGIRHASGEYILFVDGDDFLEPDALARLDEALKRYGPLDVLLFSGREYYETADGKLRFAREIKNLSRRDEGVVMTGPEIIARVGRSGCPANNFTPLHLYSAAYLRKHGLFQAEGIMHEDSEWVPRSWYHAGRAAVADLPLYNYRRRRNSVTTACSPKLLHDVAVVTVMRIGFFFSHEFPEEVASALRNQYLSLFFWYFFHPMYRKRFAASTRTEALDIVIGTPEKAAAFKRLADGAPLPKRVAVPLILFAGRSGNWLPADIYFRAIYYPLSRLRPGRKS